MTFGPLENLINIDVFVTLGVQGTPLGGAGAPKGDKGSPQEVRGALRGGTEGAKGRPEEPTRGPGRRWEARWRVGRRQLDIYAAPGQGPAARRGDCFSSVILTRIPKGIPPHPGPRTCAAGLLKFGLFWCVLSLVQPGAVLTSKVVPKGSQERP